MSTEEARRTEFDTPSIDVERKKPSMMYSILPAVVQNRIPTLPSIRRTISDVRGRSMPDHSTPEAIETPTPRTPPPGYTSRPSTAGSSSSSNRSSVVSTDGELPFQEAVSEYARSSMSTPPPFPISETRTGINWKYSNQGVLNMESF